MEKTIEIKEPDEMAVGNSMDIIRISNITSGVGLVLVDLVKKFGVGAYLVLATRASKQITQMLNLLTEKGTVTKDIAAKMAGGANFMSMNMGSRISQKVIEACQEMKIPITGKDVGGAEKRTLAVSLSTGKMKVVSASGEQRIRR